MANSQIGTANLLEAYSAQTVAELRQESMWLQLTSQEGTERWASGEANKVNIPVPNYTAGTVSSQTVGVDAADRARGGDWTTARSMRDSSLTFQRSSGSNVSNELDVEDVAELTWDILEGVRSRQQYELRREIDTKLYTAWTAGIGTNAAQQTTYGTSTNAINRAAPYATKGTGTYEWIWNAVQAFAIKCKRANVDSIESDSVGRKFMVLPVELMVGFANWMLEQNFQWDALTNELLSEGSVRGGGMFQGRLLGIDLFTDNNIAVPTGSADWNFFAGVRASWRANVRRLPGYTQIFSPAENQTSTKPAYLMREAVDMGWLEISSGDLANLNHRFVIDGG